MFRFRLKTLGCGALTMLLTGLVTFQLEAQTSAGSDSNAPQEMTKTANLPSGGWVEIHNEYGDLHVQTSGPSGKVTVVASLDAEGEEEDVAKLLKRLKVDVKEKSSRVVITGGLDGSIRRMTDDEKGTKITFDDGEKLKVDDFTIDIRMTIPANANLEINQTFGDIDVGDIKGELHLNGSYADFELGDASRLVIAGSFLDGSAQTVGNCEIAMDYSEIEIGEAADLQLKSSFSEFEIGKANSIVSSSGYNEYEIESLGTLTLDEEFTDIEIENISQSANIKLTYGSVEVGMNKGFASLDVNSSFGDLDINLPDEDGFNLDLFSEMGDIDIPQSFEVDSEEEGILTTHLMGKHKSGGKLVKLHSSYGSMTLKLK